jgi:hypothetical protein
VETDLHGRAWGLMSRSAGIRLDLAAIEADTAEYDGPYVKPNFTTAAVGILLHEIGHAACWPKPEQPPTLSPTEAAAVVELWATRDETAPPDPAPWFDDHGAEFIRAVLHVHHRAMRLLRFPIDLATLLASESYGLSPLPLYVEALAGEPARLARKPFKAILTTCPPTAFAELWRVDTRRWLDTIDSPTPEQRAAVAAAQNLFPFS